MTTEQLPLTDVTPAEPSQQFVVLISWLDDVKQYDRKTVAVVQSGDSGDAAYEQLHRDHPELPWNAKEARVQVFPLYQLHPASKTTQDERRAA